MYLVTDFNKGSDCCLLCLQSVRDILLVGHRQAVAWIDDWYGK